MINTRLISSKNIDLILSLGGVVPVAAPEGHIEYKQVKFSYPSRQDIEVLKNLELNITPGKMVAVVGPSGSG